VSRRFVAATEHALAELLAADLSGLDLVALLIDGIRVAEHTCVVALGITLDGTKVPLALAEGATENATVVGDLLARIALPERDLAGHRWLDPDSEFDWSSARMPSNSRCRATPPGTRRLAAWLERSLGPQPRSAGPRPPGVVTGSG
jgi:hypothetical protein